MQTGERQLLVLIHEINKFQNKQNLILFLKHTSPNSNPNFSC